MAYQKDLPTAENLSYGDATVRANIPSARRHLSPLQFPVKVRTPSLDAGWLGPMGAYGKESSPGSLYGYGMPSSDTQY